MTDRQRSAGRASNQTLNEALAAVGWRSETIALGSGRKRVYDETGAVVEVDGSTKLHASTVWAELGRRGLIGSAS